jgi:predicted deacetylase
MSVWLDKLWQALDDAPRPVAFFFRDDDAGWSDDRLLELLDLFGRYSMPIDLAAIPGALTSGLAAELRARIEAEPEGVAVHQHGFDHRNHEPLGRRKCEFGIARGPARQRSDIEQGKSLLEDLFGPLVSPIFTPPWNRCARITGECLLRTGFRILSRDQTATPLCLDGLVELPVTIDWFSSRKGARLSLDELGARMACAVTAPAPVGIMFHHALMDETERERTGELLDLLASHRNAKRYLMDQLVTDLSQEMEAQVQGQADRLAAI